MICALCQNKFISVSGRTRCGSCVVKIRRTRIKLAAIKYKGGKCERCGYDCHPSALEFHHVNDEDKLFGISAKDTSWAKVKSEIDKCELLCSNCHRIEHTNKDENFLKAVYEYSGKLDIDG